MEGGGARNRCPCKGARYCDDDCQGTHWKKVHKYVCSARRGAKSGEQLERGRTAYERLLAAARGEWEAADPAGRGPFAPDLPGVGLEINPIATLEKQLLNMIGNLV